jgi:hypothetical protein
MIAIAQSVSDLTISYIGFGHSYTLREEDPPEGAEDRCTY